MATATLSLSTILPNRSSSHSRTPISASIKPKPKSSSSSDSPLPPPPPCILKLPTAPWMKNGSLVQVPDPPKDKDADTKPPKHHANDVLTGKLVGMRGRKSIKHIVRGIHKLQHSPQHKQQDHHEQDHNQVFVNCLEGFEDTSAPRERMPWEESEERFAYVIKKERVPTAAELSLDKELLERLRDEAKGMRKWVKVMKAGVTQAVVDNVHLIWKRNELAQLKFDIPLSRNMARAQEILETKTGGLVVWRWKDTLVIYRGCNYLLSSKPNYTNTYAHPAAKQETSTSNCIQMDLEKSNIYQDNSNEKVTNNNAQGSSVILETNVGCQPSKSLYEKEADRLLDGLGPRFIDWWMHKPLPVDADLLPELVPGYKPPTRRCPMHTRVQLKDDELTCLRKIARPLPTHFVLGRNRKLQGLAAAILKLWEKSIIAKIAVKWGVPNTKNEEMAYELKCLTGGVLLLRNKFIILLYRGKDFLPCVAADSIAEREAELNRYQLHEEHARLKSNEAFRVANEPIVNTGSVGTISEFHDIQTMYGDLIKVNKHANLQIEAEKERLERDIRNQERKFFILNKKVERSKNKLLKLSAARPPAAQDVDIEIMTEEERECFRKIGLKMQSFLLLGRRGVFDGVMEGIHQHWKHREVVKVITMQKQFRQVAYTSKLLEAESGGVLVSVDKLKEGYAIIIYRGKNYKRPIKRISGNLLSKRNALLRSLEIQRFGSLKYFASQKQQAAFDLTLKLESLQKHGETTESEV